MCLSCDRILVIVKWNFLTPRMVLLTDKWKWPLKKQWAAVLSDIFSGSGRIPRPGVSTVREAVTDRQGKGPRSLSDLFFLLTLLGGWVLGASFITTREWDSSSHLAFVWIIWEGITSLFSLQCLLEIRVVIVEWVVLPKDVSFLVLRPERADCLLLGHFAHVCWCSLAVCVFSSRGKMKLKRSVGKSQ